MLKGTWLEWHVRLAASELRHEWWEAERKRIEEERTNLS